MSVTGFQFVQFGPEAILKSIVNITVMRCLLDPDNPEAIVNEPSAHTTVWQALELERPAFVAGRVRITMDGKSRGVHQEHGTMFAIYSVKSS